MSFSSKTIKVFFIGALFLMVLGLSAPNAFAQSTQSCECFCTSKNGAVSVGKTTSDQCLTKCDSTGQKMVVCANSAEEMPNISNLRCFTKEGCEKEIAGRPGGVWDSKPAPDCQGNYHYCYAKEEPVNLAISIGGTTQVLNIGDYINTFYKYLIAASAIIVVVMLIIYGIQYIISPVSGKIEEAKGKMRSTVAGLVLLLCATLILQTVNPNLRTLSPPKFPKVRRVELISDATSCEYLIKDQGYVKGTHIDNESSPGRYGMGLCGSVAKILQNPDGSAAADGAVCVYRKCPYQTDFTGDEMCVGVGEKAECMSCGAITPINKAGITPTSEVCQAVETEMQKKDKVDPKDPNKLLTKSYCFHTHDPNMLFDETDAATATGLLLASGLPGIGVFTAALGIEKAQMIYTGTCTEMNLDCSKINKCTDYNGQKVFNDIEDEDELRDLEHGEYLIGDETVKTVCESDPCGAGAKEKEGGICVLQAGQCANSKEKSIEERYVPTTGPKI